MRAVRWHGPRDVRVEHVPDPQILNPRDAIVKITATAICGSDLHLYNGVIPTMRAGDVLGHEFMGEVVEVGPRVRNLARGTRVVVPFAIACGGCFFCREQLTSLCDNSNPNAEMAEALYGFSGSGLFGYSHLYGGYPGGQAELVRVPFADVGPIAVPDGLRDEQVLFLSDIFPTGYMAAENCGIRPGDTIAVWGCGPVGQMAIKSAYLLGAERVIAIDRWPARLLLAETGAKAETLNYEQADDVVEELKQRTGGRGPDACIDAVGMEAHGTSLDARVDRAKQAVGLGTDRPHALRQAIQACRKGGDGVDSRRLRRPDRQAAARRGVREGVDAPDGTDRRASVPPPPAGSHRGRAHRPLLHHQSSLAAHARRRGVPDVQRQARRLHEGRPGSYAMSPAGRAARLLLGGVALGAGYELVRRRRRWHLGGRVVLVTGGSRGLGLLLARQLLGEGARVAICARDEATLMRARRELETRSASVMAIPCDVTAPEQVARMVRQVDKQLGPIDAVINNAGTIAVGPVDLMALDDFQDAMNTNFWGVLHVILAVLPDMRRRGAGRIVNIASIGGKVSVPHLLPYSASKFALVGLSEGLRAELAQAGILVTTICPGLMRTGSPRHASFKGQYRAEYAWFSISDSLPVISMDAERAARQIIDALRWGEAERILSFPAKLLTTAHGVFAGLTAELLAIVNRGLPRSAAGAPRTVVKGEQSTSPLSPSWLTRLGDQAAIRNNQTG
jgi:threonine dehydrogenase-like Zn-dependent dehydrogenase/NAD(P)-dependent dehydrogenase (short-subunit alcohol dehydrogenase family)